MRLYEDLCFRVLALIFDRATSKYHPSFVDGGIADSPYHVAGSSVRSPPQCHLSAFPSLHGPWRPARYILEGVVSPRVFRHAMQLSLSLRKEKF